MAKILEKEVSAVLEDAARVDFIFNVGQNEGINFVADKSLPPSKPVSGEHEAGKTVRVSYISRNLNLQFQIGEEFDLDRGQQGPHESARGDAILPGRELFCPPSSPPEVQTTTRHGQQRLTVTRFRR